MKSFLRFISRNSLYTVIEVAGMAIALAFIIFIGTYITQESSYDTFVGEDIYIGSDSEFFGLSGTIKGSVEGRYPDIEAICRLIGTKYLNGLDLSTSIGDETMVQNALCVDSNFLSLIPVPMVTGDRGSALEATGSVIISRSFADQWFPEGNAVGNSVDITAGGEKASLLVTGIFEDMERTVLPECDMIYRLDFLERYVPYLTRNGNGTTVTLYKIREGADLSTISREILGILKESDALYMSGICTEYRLIPFKEVHYGSGANYPFPFENIVNRDMLRLFTAAGVLLLVFALLNYISLTTAQVGFRVREMATRRLIGSSRAGIILRYIGESLAVTAVAFILGFILAEATSPLFNTLIGKTYSPLASLTWGTAALWAGIIVLLSVIAGIIPAMMVSRYRPIDIVRGEFSRASKMILGRIFLVVQNVAAIGAVAISIAMFLQLRHMVEKPMGYTRDSLVDVTGSNTQNPDDFLKDRLKSLPCVAEVGWTQGCPAGGRRSSWGMELDGNRYSVVMFDGDTTALRLLGVRVLSQNAEPLPGTFYFTRRTAAALGLDMNATLFEYDYGAINVCGIIDDLWMGNANSTDNDMLIWTVQPSEPQSLGNMISLVVKVNGDPDDAVRTIQEFYAREKPDLNVTVETYENIYRRTYTAEDRSLRITGLFALLTIVLTVMAMVAMSTYYARQRAKSTAVRKIMGCPRSEIYTHTLASFLSASLIAAVIAIPLIYTYTGRWLQTYSYHIGNYWWIYLLALLIVAAIAALAITYRAVQLMNTNPAIALRKD